MGLGFRVKGNSRQFWDFIRPFLYAAAQGRLAFLPEKPKKFGEKPVV